MKNNNMTAGEMIMGYGALILFVIFGIQSFYDSSKFIIAVLIIQPLIAWVFYVRVRERINSLRFALTDKK